MKQISKKRTPVMKVADLAVILFFLCLSSSAFAQTVPSSGTLTLNNGQTASNSVTLSGNLTINVTNGTAYVTGKISGPSNCTVTKTGVGKLVFTNYNDYYGPTIITDGKLQIGDGYSGGIQNTANVEIASGKPSALSRAPV